MVLINIETLSTTELRYIAEQEELQDWETLSREELIDSLEEVYGDDSAHEKNYIVGGHKFFKSLTGLDADTFMSLPGVDELPETYNETIIRFLQKDENWAYAYWSIIPSLIDELEESSQPYQLILRSLLLPTESKEGDVYDIEIDLEDSNWSIALPWAGREYKAQLILVQNGAEQILCESNVIRTLDSFLSKHKEILSDQKTFALLFSSLVSKSGELLDNRQVRELADVGIEEEKNEK